MSNGIKVLFGAVLGALYAGIGILQLVWAVFGPLAGLEALLISGDVFSGFVLLVIGAILLAGAWKLSTGTREGISFIYVGTFLSVLFGLVALCSLGAGALEATFFAEEGEEAWSIMGAITPLLYLAVIGAAGFLAWGREFLRGFFPG
jgi:hypothetical protein